MRRSQPDNQLGAESGSQHRLASKGDWVTVTAYGLNVRAGPGMAYPIIGRLSLGDVVEVMGKSTAGSFGYAQDKAWLQIIYPIGSENRGWVSATYVDLTGSLAAVPEVSAPPLPEAAAPTSELTGKLVFQVCNGCDIYVINADGSDQRPMFETELDGLPVEYGFVAERMVSWTK